jgi:hypothetical protein
MIIDKLNPKRELSPSRDRQPRDDRALPPAIN